MVSGTRRVAAALAALVVLGAGAEAASAHSFDLEGHRGTRGLRPENTLAAFGKALQIGVTTLELDTGVTKDGVVVVSHERRISSLECQGPYVGKLIHELTYAQIQKLDCGTRHPADPSTDPFVGTQEAVPGTHMPSLAQVFQLVNRYGADRVQFDIETKRDPTLPKETVGPTTFAKKVIAVISRYHMTKRAVLQSFDWSTLQAARKIKPRLRRAALAQATTIFPGTPWTGGIDIKPNPFDGDLARVVADKLHAQVLSVNYPDITDALIKASHQHGLTIIPWTVDAPADMAAAIDRGLDGLITDYPDKARDVMDAKGLDLPEPFESPFDIEGHRGARAYRPENTLSAYRLRPRPRGRHAGDGHRRDQGRRARHVAQPPGQRRALPRHGAGHAGRSALPLRGQEHQGPHAGPDQDARLRLHRSGLPQAGPPARREDAHAAGGLRPRGRRAATRTCASTSRRRSARWSTTPCPTTS